MILPPPPRPGDRVAVVAPAGPILARHLDAGLAPLRAAGYDLVVADDLVDRGAGSYLAGTDEERANELSAALQDATIKAVVCVRGGYGAMRIVSAALDRLADPVPKRVTGFSDITAIHAALYTTFGWVSLHAPMPFNFVAAGRDRAVAASAHGFRTTLAASSPQTDPAWPVRGLIPVVGGQARGPLVGGNLTLVDAIYRSPLLPTLAGAILVIEDVGEKPYRLDRLVTSLALRGAAEEVAGVVVAGFNGCGLPPDAAAAIVAAHFGAWGVPVVRGLDSGHRHPNRPFWHGWPHEMDADLGVLRPMESM